jgi:hypothetical protein
MLACLAVSTSRGEEPATAFAHKKSFVKDGGLLNANGDLRQLHTRWHDVDGLPNPAANKYTLLGKDFLEFHRELTAQFDDFSLSGPATTAPVVKYQASIPWVPDGKTQADGTAVADGKKLYGMIRPSASSENGFFRKTFQNIYNNTDGNGMQIPVDATGVPVIARHAKLKLGNADFKAFTVDGLGNAIDSGTGVPLYEFPIIGPTVKAGYHGLGHILIRVHDMDATSHGDHVDPKYNVKDVSFYHWHKHIDNIYADWALAQYRDGTPLFFSVDVGAEGAAGSKLAERNVADVYFAGSDMKPDGTALAQASTYGAKPRIASDVYVADNDDKNLVYHYGIRKWADPVHTANASGEANNPANPRVLVTQDATKFWNFDAYSDMNQALGNAIYFSVSKDSMGKMGSIVRGQAPNLGGDVFSSPADGDNALYREEKKLGLKGTDELDALEIDFQKLMQATNDEEKAEIHDRDRQYFSLKKNSINGQQAYKDAANVREASGADILNFGPDGRLFIAVPHTMLGLAAGDDLDALFMLDVNKSHSLDKGDKIYFSLDKGSPALGARSAADLFLHTLGQKFDGHSLATTSADLGLLDTDNVDGLDQYTISKKKKDFGDAPDSYGTLEGTGGPRYYEGDLQSLGFAWDGEIDAQPTDNALGDDDSQLGGDPVPYDDDDGVTFGANDVSIAVRSNRSGLSSYRLRGWFDLDDDGEFNHSTELKIDSIVDVTPGDYNFNFPLGFDPQLSFSRFRLDWIDDPLGLFGGVSLLTDVTPVGEFLAADGFSHGEVEDFAAIPEPATMLLVAIAVGPAAMGRRSTRGGRR